MSQTYVTVEVRRVVVARANRCCEYCCLHEDDTVMGCQVDHIISEKHGGPTTEENLAYSCALCNYNKGSDIGSITLPLETGSFCRFYNPRTDTWSGHFAFDPSDGITIHGLTDIGRVTARIFGFNRAERLLERSVLFAAGRYPPT